MDRVPPSPLQTASETRLVEHSFVIESECAGWRLDRFLKKKIPRLSRVRLQRVIRGDCQVDGRPCKPSQAVMPGQRVTFRRPAPKEPDAPRDLPVLLSDPDFYVLDKPAGLPMHPTAKYHYSTVTAVLRERFVGEPLQIAHRLDRETSGALLVARHREAAVALKRAFAKRRIEKRYLALVHGQPENEGLIDLPLGLGGGLVRVRMAVRDDGLPARTRYRVLERFADHALVECRPETGRQHQIRAHLAAIGFPIVGDKLYPDETIFARYQDEGWDAVAHALPLDRHALHAAGLLFPHPTSGEQIAVESPLAGDLRRFIDGLGAPID